MDCDGHGVINVEFSTHAFNKDYLNEGSRQARRSHLQACLRKVESLLKYLQGGMEDEPRLENFPKLKGKGKFYQKMERKASVFFQRRRNNGVPRQKQ